MQRKYSNLRFSITEELYEDSATSRKNLIQERFFEGVAN